MKLLFHVITVCSGWHLPPFAICSLIGTTELLQPWSILIVALNWQEICMYFSVRWWVVPTFPVLEIMVFPSELLSHLEGVHLQLWGRRLAPGCHVCCGGQPQHLCSSVQFLCTARHCQAEEQRGMRSTMSQCLLIKGFTQAVGGLPSIPILAATA